MWSNPMHFPAFWEPAVLLRIMTRASWHFPAFGAGRGTGQQTIITLVRSRSPGPVQLSLNKKQLLEEKKQKNSRLKSRPRGPEYWQAGVGGTYTHSRMPPQAEKTSRLLSTSEIPVLQGNHLCLKVFPATGQNEHIYRRTNASVTEVGYSKMPQYRNRISVLQPGAGCWPFQLITTQINIKTVSG